MFELRYKLSKFRERLANKVVWKLPAWVIYRSGIRMMAHATTGQYSNQVVPELTALEALERWDKK